MTVVCTFTTQDSQEKNFDSYIENRDLPRSWGDMSLLILFNNFYLLVRTLYSKINLLAVIFKYYILRAWKNPQISLMDFCEKARIIPLTIF